MAIKVLNWRFKIAGVLLLAAMVLFVPWMFASLNWEAPWLAIPFAAASLLTVVANLVTIINHWSAARPDPSPVPPGEEPDVVVIIPTHGEPPEMVYETARSVLEQDYPLNRLLVVISDDARRSSIRAVVDRLRAEQPRRRVGYHQAHGRGDPRRRGEAKAGNLNSVMDLLDEHAPQIAFVETRDADDKVGDPAFLRQAVGQLLADPRAAFVQTIKEAQVSDQDPFGNLESIFYQKLMLHRQAANAVFPCGSGLVWRRAALDEIGGFPAWNLVEDLQSGVEALRRGWRGIYLPVVGAVAQVAPEDIPNAVKQRGTWAIDTMRLLFWGSKKGLNVRQRLQFLELGLFYLLSFALLTFVIMPVFTLFLGHQPLRAPRTDYLLYFWPYVLGIELMLTSLVLGIPYRHLWRSRQIWFGMAPVFARSILIALFFGPRRKPTYRVTRKEHAVAWYWREVWVQSLLFALLLSGVVYHVLTQDSIRSWDLGSLFWATFFALLLSRTVRNSWHGIDLVARVTSALRSVFRRPSWRLGEATAEEHVDGA